MIPVVSDVEYPLSGPSFGCWYKGGICNIRPVVLGFIGDAYFKKTL